MKNSLFEFWILLPLRHRSQPFQTIATTFPEVFFARDAKRCFLAPRLVKQILNTYVAKQTEASWLAIKSRDEQWLAFYIID